MRRDEGGSDAHGLPAASPVTLREYALLADGERGALIGPHGDVAFLCAPRWHDDAVFSGLLGGRSRYQVSPCDEHYVWGGSYEPDSLVWRSRWVQGSAVIESVEALGYPGEAERLVLLRRVEAVREDAVVRLALECRPEFDALDLPLRQSAAGVWEGAAGGLHLRLSGVPANARPVCEGRALVVPRLRIPEGRHHDLVLEIGTGPPAEELPEADRLWRSTRSAWTRGGPPHDGSIAPGDVAHAWAVLRGLTSSTGALVAAATTSMPERAEEGKDYDYRYAWIRDQCYAGLAAAAAGGGSVLDDAVGFVTQRLLEDRDRLAPAYTVTGEPVPAQRELALPGYPGAPGPRIGNHVRDQFQLDVFGEALLLLAAATDADHLDSPDLRAVEVAVAAIERRYGEADAGLWELAPRRWAHSRLTCASGLRAASRLRHPRSADWLRLAEKLVEDVDRDCRHPSGRWQRSPGDPAVDAALLLPAIRGAVPASDPRSVATWEAVLEELAVDGHVYRFRQQPGPLNQAEGAFVLCGFLMALATQQQGETRAALRWFERSRGALGPPGLFTEEYDVVQRQLRGNLPQAFVHALLIESAYSLARPGTDLRGFGPADHHLEKRRTA